MAVQPNGKRLDLMKELRFLLPHGSRSLRTRSILANISRPRSPSGLRPHSAFRSSTFRFEHLQILMPRFAR